jgi:carbon storage regulator
MLVLSRRKNESVVIDGRIRLTVIEVRGNQIRLGIEAPADVRIARSELLGSRAAPSLEAPLLPTPAAFPVA